jgi:Uma2 family endonuclease
MATQYEATIVDLEQAPDDGFRYELLRGELTHVAPTGEAHGDVVRELIWRLESYVRAHDPTLGKVVVPDTAFVLARDPDTTVVPDVAFIRFSRLANARDRTRYIHAAPDLAVEVISPSDKPTRIARKVALYLEMGVGRVLLIDPEARTVDVFRPDAPSITLRADDVFEAGDILPGFQFRTGDIFS